MALYSLANQAGAAFRSALNTVLGKIHGNYIGSTDPVSAGDQTAGMLWVDTNASPATLKIRNAANSAWVSVGQVDTSFLLAGSTAFGRSLLAAAAASNARTTLGLTAAIVTTTLASQAEAQAGVNNTKLVTPLRVKEAIDALSPGATLAAQQATTSGTAFDFTGIPADVNEIVAMFDGISLTGTDEYLIQLGDSGGVETAGYESVSGLGGATTQSSTAGFMISGINAAEFISGMMIMKRMNGNKWVSMHELHRPGGGLSSIQGSGIKTLSGTLDRVRLTRTGSNTFDGGAVAIAYR